MNTEIRKLMWIQRVEYALFWGLCFLLVLAYEMDWLAQGALVGNAQAEYLSQTVGILLTVMLIPVALRLFSLSLTRYVRALPLRQALKSYRRWGEVRLCLLLVAALMNLSGYYVTMNTTGLLCAGMVFVAALFCVPGERRLKEELDLQEECPETEK